MSTEKEILLIKRLLSEGADELNGEYWLDSLGYPTLITEDTPVDEDFDPHHVFGELGWIHVNDNHFKTWKLYESSLGHITSFLHEKLDDDSGSVVIEEVSNGMIWTVPAKVVMCEGISPEDIKRYARGDIHEQIISAFLSEEP
jgi:hypothetical protein